MKRDYETPEFMLTILSFEEILEDTTKVVLTSENEDGGEDHKDDDDTQW